MSVRKVRPSEVSTKNCKTCGKQLYFRTKGDYCNIHKGYQAHQQPVIYPAGETPFSSTRDSWGK